jgi:hypothetical protein
MSIAELSIKRPVTAVMLFVSLFVIGLIAAVRLPLESFPSVTPPLIFVQPYTGSPEEAGAPCCGRSADGDDVGRGAPGTGTPMRRPAGGVHRLGAHVAIAASRRDASTRYATTRRELQRYFVFKIARRQRSAGTAGQRHQNLTGAYDLIGANSAPDRSLGRGARGSVWRHRTRPKSHARSPDRATHRPRPPKSLQALNFSCRRAWSTMAAAPA